MKAKKSVSLGAVSSSVGWHDRKGWNWKNALSRKEYTWSQLNQMRERSGDWTTCACGSACKRLPRHCDNSPVDHKLHVLGSRFHDAIESMGFWHETSNFEESRKEAIKILDQIEDRAIFLLAQKSYDSCQ